MKTLYERVQELTTIGVLTLPPDHDKRGRYYDTVPILEGWIDEIDDNIVYGRFIYDGDEWEFDTSIYTINEAQRADLEPGLYIYIINGHIFLNRAITTTKDVEDANREAKKLYHSLGWDRLDKGTKNP